MTDQAKEARREYMRAWTAANPDKVKAKNARYWEKRAALNRQKAAESAENAGKAEAPA